MVVLRIKKYTSACRTVFSRRVLAVKKDSRGVVAIFSVLVIMGILGLFTIGFSTVVRQSQKRTLDEHLSNQAFYAAESGVNIVKDKLLSGSVASIVGKPDCSSASPYLASDDYNIDSDNGISISCLLVSDKNKEILNQNISYKGVSNHLESSGGNISSITLRWDSVGETKIRNAGIADATTPVHGSATLPNLYPANEWQSSGADFVPSLDIMKIEIVPFDSNFERGVLANASSIYYLYPLRDEGENPIEIKIPGDKGKVIFVRCNSPSDTYRCEYTFNVNSAIKSHKFKVFQRAMYSDYTGVGLRSELTINDGTSSIINSQLSIDSTGKASDVLRRIEVRLNVDGDKLALDNGESSDLAIFSGDGICKLYRSYKKTPRLGQPSSTEWKDECTSDGITGSS